MCKIIVNDPTHLIQTLYQMLKQCLPVALHAPCHLIFLTGKELEAIKVICQKTYTFNTDSVLNVKYMLTSFLAGVSGGDDDSEPALKEVLWNNV